MTVGRAVGEQSNSDVLQAELWRLRGSTSLLVQLAVAVALGVLGVGATYELTVAVSGEDFGMAPGALALSVGAFLSAACISFVIILRQARERFDGTIVSTLRLVPNRVRALIARSVALVALSIGASVLWAGGSLAYIVAAVDCQPLG